MVILYRNRQQFEKYEKSTKKCYTMFPKKFFISFSDLSSRKGNLIEQDLLISLKI